MSEKNTLEVINLVQFGKDLSELITDVNLQADFKKLLEEIEVKVSE